MTALFHYEGRVAFDGQRKVHVAALGHQELDRFLEPLQRARVDRLYLLVDEQDEGASWYTEQDPPVDAHAEIKALGLEQFEEVPVRMWDAHSVAAAIISIAQRETAERVYVNVSVGPKPVALGATLASLFSNVSLYYAEVDYHQEADPVRGRHVDDIQLVPTFKAERPEDGLILALKAFAKEENARPAAVFKRHMKESNPPCITPRDGETWESMKHKDQYIHAQFESYRRRLDSLGAIIPGDDSSRRTYQISDQGRALLRMFA